MPRERGEYFGGLDLEARVAQLEEQLGMLMDDPSLRNLPYGSLKQAASMLSLVSIGNALSGARAAGNPSINPGTVSGVALVANYLYALPLYVPEPLQLARLGLYVSTLASNSIRLGIYEDKGEKLLYPGKLLVDAGAVSAASTGVKAIDVKLGLARGLKWVVLVTDGTPSVFFIPADSTSGLWSPLGFSEVGSFYTHWRVAFTYAALPNPFTAGGTEMAGAIPFIFLKFS